MALTPRRLFIAILFIALALMATREVSDPDFWWHLRTGQYIVETGSIPHADIFSATNAGQPWVTHEWLTEVLFYLLYRLGSFPALIVTFALVVASAFAFVYARSPGKPYIAAATVLLAALASAPTWGVRPQVVSLLFTSFFLWVLDRSHAQPNSRLVWLLVPLMVLWANMHSGFLLGLVVMGAYLFGDTVRHLQQSGWKAPDRRSPLAAHALAFTLCIAVVLINPNGLTLFVYPFGTLFSGAMQTFIQEWFSPDFHQLQFLPFAWLLLGTLGALALSGKPLTITQVVLLLGFGYAGLTSARNIPFFALVAAPVLAESLWSIVTDHGWSSWIEPTPRVSPMLLILNWVLLIGIVVATVGRVGMVVGNQSAVERAKFPAAAVDYVAEHAVSGPLYNAYGWGGYLIWRLYPNERVFIDGRADVYGDAFIGEYLKVWRGDSDWQGLLDRFGVRTVLIEPDSPLAGRLAQDSDWRRVYSDTLAVVYQK